MSLCTVFRKRDTSKPVTDLENVIIDKMVWFERVPVEGEWVRIDEAERGHVDYVVNKVVHITFEPGDTLVFLDPRGDE